MLQRVQTIWLLLAAVSAFLTLRFPIYNGNKIVHEMTEYSSLNGGSDLFLLLLTIAIGVITIITIFLYKNRPLQLKLTITALALSIVSGFLYFRHIQQFIEGGIHIAAILYFAIPVLLLLAMRGIYSDQKLVKSLDRLR